MTDDEALRIYRAGQELLAAVHKVANDRQLTRFDELLEELYEIVRVDSRGCDGCWSSCPDQILVGGQCPNCRDPA